MCFVCQRVLWFRYWKVSSCTVCLSEVLVSKGFFRLYFFSFCGFTVCVREFLQVLYVCQSLGVRALLRILLSGVSEVSRFKCQRISLGLVFQFEVLV